MFVTVLALLAPIASFATASGGGDNPTAADRALLLDASRACHLHQGAAYFVRYSPLRAPTIHTTRALGDSDAQITCVLQRLPGDFVARFGFDVESSTPPGRTRRPRPPEHKRGAVRS